MAQCCRMLDQNAVEWLAGLVKGVMPAMLL